MKNKKLLVSLAIVAVVVVIVVVMASVFAVRHVFINYHKFNGDLTIDTDGGTVPTEVVENIAKGKSTIFLSKANLLSQINAELREKYPQWHAFAVVKSFPNILDVHLVKVTAIAKLTLSNGERIYLDSFGYPVAEEPETDYCIDITSAFVDKKQASSADGSFKFESREDNERLGYVLQAILATWQCYVEIEEMNDVLLPANAFEFRHEDNMLKMFIYPRLGGTIELQSPDTDLATRLQKAYGVYYNKDYNLQNDNCVITVLKNGRIKTHDPNKQ